MAVATLAEGTPLTIEQANDVFTAVDNVLRVLFNGQSPLLYLSFDDGAGAWEASGLAGLLVVFGTQASRVILSAVASHDQGAIDSAAAAATLGAQDDTLKQVTLGLASGALSKSLVIQKRTVTVGAGTEEYFGRVEYAGGAAAHHEKVHELAAVDVVFEGHADRTFEWPTAWDKVRCVRFHNLDSDSTPLVITFEETAETLTLNRWECVTMRRVDNGSGPTWQNDGFLLWQMRDEDLIRLGNSFPWNDRVGAGANVWESIWCADGGNNVASWASVFRVLDYFAAAGMPVEIAENDGVSDVFEPKTGIAFDLSDITRNAGHLRPFPDPTDTATPIYKLAWHGGKFIAMSKDGAGAYTQATATASIDDLLAGSAALNVRLYVDAGGNSAHLKVIDGTDVELIDLIPVGSNIGASGHPFTVPDDGTGYNVPPAAPVTWDGINRLNEFTTSETVVGIGGNATTDYTELRVENSGDPWGSGPFELTIGDVQGWAFPTGGKNNDHGTFYSNSVKWDGRRLAVNALLRLDPVDGAFPSGPAALTLAQAPSAIASFGYVEWYQAADVQGWPVSGGPWLTPNYVRRSMPPVDPAMPLAHPNAAQYLGTPTGGDYEMRDSRLFKRAKGIKRQLPINDITGGGLTATSVDLTGCYFVAEDSTQTIIENVSTAGWWSTNRATAISGAAIGSEVRPVVAPVLRARHFNVLAQRINAVLSVVPFSFFDAQYYGRDFRPDYTSGGIFGGHVYPYGFVRYNTGTAATRATALSLTVRDFQTEFSGYGVYSNEDVDIIDYSGPGGGTSGRGFDVSNGTGLDLWNTDLPYWFNPSPSPALARNESVVIHKSSPGTGWVQGELVFSTVGPAVDWYAWQLPNDSNYAFPDFEYLRADDLDGLASDLGIPFRLIRLFASWEPYKFTPDRQGLGVRYVIQWEPSNTWTRTEVRLVPAIISEAFVTFAGTGDLWGTHGLVRVSDWPVCPTTQGSDDAVVQQSNADPMHGLNRGSGSGFVIEFPFGFYKPGSTATPTWHNDGPFDGEARHLSFEAYDTTPTPPTGWTAAVHRLASYPVPITEWGASEIETHAAPSCDPAWIRLSDLSQKFDAADLWGQQGSGAWGGEGAFAVHLFTGSIMSP